MDRRTFFKCGFVGSLTALLFKPLNAFSFTKTSKINLEDIEMEEKDVLVGVYIKHKGRLFSGYLLIPPEKQNMKYIRTQTSGMAGSQDRTIKRLLNLGIEE